MSRCCKYRKRPNFYLDLFIFMQNMVLSTLRRLTNESKALDDNLTILLIARIHHTATDLFSSGEYLFGDEKT